MACKFAALWLIDSKFTALKDLNPFKTVSKVQEASSILRVSFACSIYITISTFTSVCPYGVRRPSRHVTSRPTSNFYHVQSSRSPVRPLLSEAKPSYVYSILKPHGQSSKRQVWLLLSEAKPSCVYSILKPHGQSFRRPVRLLLSEAKPSYVYSILKPHGQSFRNPNCCSQQHSITSPCGFRIE